MARTPTSTPSSVSETQAAASTALAALLARRRGIKIKPSEGVRKVRKPKAKKVEVPEKDKSRIVARNVMVLKGAGKVGEKEREVRMRILGMREEKSGKKKRKGKRVVVEDSDSD